MKTGVIILNYNNSDDTINCINSFLAVNDEPCKVVVVDNGSRKENLDKMKNYLTQKSSKVFEAPFSQNLDKADNFNLIISYQNLGYAKGNELGVSLLKNDDDVDKLLIVNNDILFVDNILKELRNFEQSRDDVGIVSPILYTKEMKSYDYTCARLSPGNWMLLFKYLFMDLATFNFSEKLDAHYYLLKKDPQLVNKQFIKVDLPSGSCMFMDKQMFLSIDSFDPNTFLYYEENILYKKLHSHGKQNYILPKIRCIHLGASSTKSKPSSFLIKCNSDSAFYYLKRYCCLNIVQKVILALAERSMKIKYTIFKSKEK